MSGRTAVDPREQLRKDRPDSWIPVQAEDFISGTVEEVTSAYNDVQAQQGDGFYPLLRIKVTEAPGYEPGKVLAVHAFSAVLRDRILDQQPVPGEQITITYEGIGEKKRPGQNAPALYRLKVEGRDPKDEARRAYGGMARRRRPNRPPTADEPTPGNEPADEDLQFLN